MTTRRSRLVLCGACARHFRLHESACPFCGVETRDHASSTLLPATWEAGASRAQRYAVRAALLAGAASGASFGCSDSGDSRTDAAANDGARQGDASFTSGTGASGRGGSTASAGTSGASGTASSAGASGGASGRDGGASGAGTGQTGAGGGGGGTGGDTGSVCPGAVNPGGMLCRSSTECSPRSSCVLQAAMRCGNPTFARRDCETDADCGSGMRCQFELCSATTCVAKCSADSCGPTQSCVDGSCVAKRCDQQGAAACSQGWRCDPGAAGAAADGCAPVPCSSAEPCASNRDCAPANAAADPRGCAKRNCAQDGACDCGFCVGGVCESTLGFCYEEIAMPYGTVWPDEELV